jgi:hypothetical protein
MDLVLKLFEKYGISTPSGESVVRPDITTRSHRKIHRQAFFRSESSHSKKKHMPARDAFSV